MSLVKRLLKNSTIKETHILDESPYLDKGEVISTNVPMVNVAFGGDVDGGLCAGITVLAGPSKHFKTGFALLLAEAFLSKHPDGAILFYDAEFGTPKSYFDKFGLNKKSVLHCPITDIETLTHDLSKQLNDVTEEEYGKILVIVDSIGNLASRREANNALAGEDKADVGNRAKQLKAFFRVVTPHFSMKKIPAIMVSHTYKTMEIYSKDVVSGGTGGYYSAQDIWIIGRQQEKDDKTKTIAGYHFVIKVEKSRLVKENSKIPITILYDGFIQKYSGLLDLAVEGGIFVQEGRGYVYNGQKYKREEIENNDDFWKTVLENSTLKEYIRKKYRIVYEAEKNDGESSNEEIEEISTTKRAKKAKVS